MDTNDNNIVTNIYFYNNLGGHRKVHFAAGAPYLFVRNSIANELAFVGTNSFSIYGTFEVQDPLRAEHIAMLTFIAGQANYGFPGGPSEAKDQFILVEFGKAHHTHFPETTLNNFNVDLKGGEIHVRCFNNP